MKKILHVIDSLHTGGAEVLLVGTIKKLPGYEHHIIVLIPEIAFPEIHQYATVHVLNHRNWLSVFHTLQGIKKIARSVGPDIIHSHLFLASFFTRMALGKHPNLVYTLHTLFSQAIFKTPRLRWMEKMAYRKGHKVVAVSRYVLDDYKKEIKQCKEGYVLYNFIADNFFRTEKLKNISKKEGLNKWVAVGSLKAVKNYEGMINLFEKLYSTAADKSKMQLDIYGEGLLKKKLQDQVDRLGVPVRLMGKVENVVDVLDQYDAYISTSFYEGYGIAPMEGLAKGLPLFLSDIPVYKEVYQTKAFYFDNNRPGSFLQAFAKYQAMTRQEKEIFQQDGRDHAYALANSENYLQQLLKIYGVEK